MSRWVGFLIALILGITAGLYYAWVIDPVEYVDTSPDTLLIDYKTDYTLMVAEAYQIEGDLDLAARRLAVLGDEPPAEIVQNAILFAARAGYVDADVEQMRALERQLRSYNPLPDVPGQLPATEEPAAP
ncbi:MAG: hypothetical protein ACK2UW_17415 [Anaerolineales bacterium]|jgi:hypothetical protein